ncbi:hypothetical protein [Taklimakanibacter deserti]|uniref:hypothetical protein n=1 Tax=Taklimakanibacter deserti TaxID=2267839 RepID=UPI0034D5604E
MKRWIVAGSTLCLGLAVGLTKLTFSESSAMPPSIERGRYLAMIGGCNDCHTPGYQTSAGDVPEERWLTGNPLGFSGPWGTTYPSNLRRLLANMDEEAWVRYARTVETRPPMPWFNLRAFAEDDLRALYRFTRSLPADDTAVPDYVPSDKKPVTPHIDMVPKPAEP